MYDEHEEQVAELQRMLEVQGAQLAEALDILADLGFDPVDVIEPVVADYSD